MSLDAAVFGFVGGIAGNIVLSCASDELMRAISKRGWYERGYCLNPFERTCVKVASLANSLLFSAVDFSAADLQGGLMGSLFWESFASSVCSWREGAKYPQLVLLGSTGFGVLVGYTMDQIVKDAFRSLLEHEPGILVSVGAGFLAWNASSVAAGNLSEKIWSLINARPPKGGSSMKRSDQCIT